MTAREDSRGGRAGERLPLTMVHHRRWILLVLHLVLIPAGYITAFALRFDVDIPPRYIDVFLATLPVLMVVRLATFRAFHLLNGWWRHAGLRDLVNLVKGAVVSTGVFLLALYLMGAAGALPRSVLLLDCLITVVLFGGGRFVVRIVREEGLPLSRTRNGGKRTLLVGAGDAAEHLIRQFRRSESHDLVPVALVDDDRAKLGMHLHGLPVAGTTADLTRVVRDFDVKMVVIAIPSASREQMRVLVERCMDSHVEFKIIPSLQEMLGGRARLNELRSVQIEDLLGRPPIRLDLDEVEKDLAGRTLLVTGGAGSIGSELARQVARFHPARLVLVDQAESPLYYVQTELRREHPALDVVPVVADITNSSRMDSVFAAYLPTHVFHAAAYKHVPLMEDNVAEAIRNNVLGTLQVAGCAARHGVRKFVLISTDKAVHPSSVMGATKRVSERIVLGWPDLRGSGTDFRAVRFGNVLGSDGSVLPLFRKQLAAGGPLTLTHPDVTRYFMTIPEAVELVLQASILPEARGRIAMLEMGNPMKIVELAENLIRLSGMEPHRDIPIVFTGLRPGEKLHEELMSEVEETIPTVVEKIRIVQTDEADPATVRRSVERLVAAVEVGDRQDILLSLCALVPECVPPLRNALGTPPVRRGRADAAPRSAERA